MRSSPVVIMLVLLAACASVPPPGHLTQPDKKLLGRVGIVTGAFSPEFIFKAKFESVGDGTAGTALEYAFSATMGCASGAGGDPYAALAAGLCIVVVTPIAAIYGAIEGANNTADSESVKSMRKRVQQASSTSLQQQLLVALNDYADSMALNLSPLPQSLGPHDPNILPSYQEVADRFDTVLEVTALSLVAYTTSKASVPVRFFLNARIRVINTRDGRVIDTFPMATFSIEQPAKEWLADDAKKLRDTVSAMIRRIAEDAIDEELLIYHPSHLMADKIHKYSISDPVRPPAELVSGYALRPIFPPLRQKLLWGIPTWGWLERYQLASPDPYLEWEAFPRGYDISLGEVTDNAFRVVYDLRIYAAPRRSTDNYPDTIEAPGHQLRGNGMIYPLVYERTGLEAPHHYLEMKLKPCTTYRWTVRARFRLKGSPRATEWTMADMPMQPESVDPWLWRRNEQKYHGTQNLLPAPAALYPIIETPDINGQACPDR